MPRRARQVAASGIYHVMLRGVNRDVVFLEDEDRETFLGALARTRDLSGCLVLAYCLMDNHVHLVLRTMDESLGLVMKRLGVRYAKWFNEKYQRVGHLFQDRFLSEPVETDEYLVTLVRYMWDNPVKAGLVTDPKDYPWSSRRFLDGGSQLVDVRALRGLVPPFALESRVDEAPDPTTVLPVAMSSSRHSDAQVGRLFRAVSGVATAAAFDELDGVAQSQVVRLLRARSVSYAQIAAVTGLSASSVRRMHVAGLPDVGRQLRPGTPVDKVDGNRTVPERRRV